MPFSRQRVEAARLELHVARQLEAAETQRLEAGASTLLVLNLREVATADAARSLAEALSDQHTAHAAWLAATARGLDGLGEGAALSDEAEAR